MLYNYILKKKIKANNRMWKGLINSHKCLRNISQVWIGRLSSNYVALKSTAWGLFEVESVSISHLKYILATWTTTISRV